MTRLFRERWLLIGLPLAAALALAFGVRYAGEAFPLITLDLRMGRAEALGAAGDLALRRGWERPGFESAAAFEVDASVRDYVELEAGGAPAFRAVMREGLVSPYQWRVRLFQEGRIGEASVSFTPDGRPYGFRLTLPEKEAGATLDAERARAIAEAAARGDWGVPLEDFDRAETSKETQPGGRTDHTFVYERRVRRLGEATYRLRLVVGGDRLTELRHFVKVPEAFFRRYEQMRSVNETIAYASSLTIGLLYGVLGCGAGIVMLLRRRELLWRPALAVSLVLASLSAAASLNQVPLSWMGYDTALATATHLGHQLAWALGTLGEDFVIVFLALSAAEGLTRRAFPAHPQLWQLAKPDVAGSTGAAGRALAGLSLGALGLGYVVAFSLLTTRLLGWWQPSETLTAPDILATAAPALGPIANALHAGLWEECLFRALPLSAAALLGARLGRKRAIVGLALVVQAVIFGAAHANYPQQPAWSRLFELLLPSLCLGGVYLRFGLLPAILEHYLYDLALMSLPLFVTTAPGVGLQRVLVVGAGLAPFAVVAVARLRARTWADIPRSALNGAWTPEQKSDDVVETAAPMPHVPNPRSVRALFALGAAGLVAWSLSTRFEQDGKALDLTREEAETAALRALAAQGLEVRPPWVVLSALGSRSPGTADALAWESLGRDRYRGLLGSWLAPASWRIRVARFEGDVAERAEEWSVVVGPGGRILELDRELPEARPGASLGVEAARELARAAAKAQGLDVARLEPIESRESRRPARRDWSFGWKARLHGGLEGRASVRILGGEYGHVSRSLHVPEERWRDERRRWSLVSLRAQAAWSVLCALLLAGVAAAALAWARRKLPADTLAAVAFAAALLGLFQVANEHVASRVWYSTAETLQAQTLRALGAGALAALVSALALGLLAALAQSLTRGRPLGSARGAARLGVPLGLLAAGLLGLPRALAGPELPRWASFHGADATVVPADVAVMLLRGYLNLTILALLAVGVLRRIRERHGRAALPLATLLAAVLAAGDYDVLRPTSLVLETACLLLALLLADRLVLHAHPSALPIATATMAALDSLAPLISGAFPGARAGTLFGVLAVSSCAYMAVVRLDAAVAFRPPRRARQGSPAMLELTDLVRTYGGLRAVDGLSLAVRPGEIVGLLGPNGAGKTTTMRVIAGILRPDEGSVLIDGFDLAREERRAKQRMAYIPEVPHPYDLLTVREHIQLVAMCYGTLDAFDRSISNLLARLELVDKQHALVATLSKGMRQKLAVACALIHGARLLVCDEPLMGIDPRGQNEVKEELRRLRAEGCSILVSTHQLDTAERLCDRLIVMHKGRTVAEGTLDELQARARGSQRTLENVFLRLIEEEEAA